MFKRLDDAAADRAADDAAITITLDGQTLAARAGDTVAAALFAHNVASCRATPVTGAPRGPYCMMGVCYDCLVMIDGQANQQACMTLVRDGMRVARQHGAREVA